MLGVICFVIFDLGQKILRQVQRWAAMAAKAPLRNPALRQIKNVSRSRSARARPGPERPRGVLREAR